MEPVTEKVYVPNLPVMAIYTLLHEYWMNNLLIWCLSKFLEWVDSSRRDLDQRESSQNICDPKLQNFCSQISNFNIIFVLSIFENVFASKTFIFTCCFAMSQWEPIRNIRLPSDKVEYVSVAYTVRLWDCGNDGYLWVHTSAVINIPPRSGNSSTTIQTH